MLRYTPSHPFLSTVLVFPHSNRILTKTVLHAASETLRDAQEDLKRITRFGAGGTQLSGSGCSLLYQRTKVCISAPTWGGSQRQAPRLLDTMFQHLWVCTLAIYLMLKKKILKNSQVSGMVFIEAPCSTSTGCLRSSFVLRNTHLNALPKVSLP